MAALWMLVGCSTVRVYRVEPWREPGFWSEAGYADASGIRYWISAPYLLVRKPIELERIDGICRFDGKEFTLASPIEDFLPVVEKSTPDDARPAAIA